MAMFSSGHHPVSLLIPSHKSSLISNSPFPNFLIPKTPDISVSVSAIRLRPVTRRLCICSKNNENPSFNGKSSSSIRIFIKGLPLSTTEGFLAKTFSCFGTVNRVKIITEKSSEQSLGFAYVWFACEKAAQLAVKEMDGKLVDGRFVAVSLARPESPTSQVRVIPYKF